MPTYAYTVRDTAGAVRKGVSEAESESILARRLREQGFQIANIKQTRAVSAARTVVPKGGGFGRVKLTDLSIFCRQFSTMMDAGVSLVRCLNVLSEQSSSAKLRRIIMDIRTEVEAGNSLSKAMSKYPTVFS